MRKVISLLLVLVMAVPLCGCNAGENKDSAETEATEVQEIPAEEEEYEEEIPTAEDEAAEEVTLAVSVEAESPAVYWTKTGECYHKEWCQYLQSKIEITVDNAKAIGLRPCTVCNP